MKNTRAKSGAKTSRGRSKDKSPELLSPWGRKASANKKQDSDRGGSEASPRGRQKRVKSKSNEKKSKKHVK